MFGFFSVLVCINLDCHKLADAQALHRVSHVPRTCCEDADICDLSVFYISAKSTYDIITRVSYDYQTVFRRINKKNKVTAKLLSAMMFQSAKKKKKKDKKKRKGLPPLFALFEQCSPLM